MRKLILSSLVLAVAGCSPASETNGETSADTKNETKAEAPLAIKASDASLQWGACPPIFPAGCEITVLHGAPDKPNADVFLRVPGGYQIPPHRHTSAERMILVGGTLNVEYQGSPAATLNAGDYAFGPAKLPHRAQCTSSEPCILFIAFEGPVDAEVAEMAAG